MNESSKEAAYPLISPVLDNLNGDPQRQFRYGKIRLNGIQTIHFLGVVAVSYFLPAMNPRELTNEFCFLGSGKFAI